MARTHGMSHTPEHKTWRTIIDRTTNPKNNRFQKYGARGIVMCKEWLEDFQVFFEYVGPRPGIEYSIDRIDNAKGYQPGNVRWSTAKEQARNRSSNTRFQWADMEMTLTEWCERAGMNPKLVRERISTGWPFEVAISTPVGQSRKVAGGGEPAAVTKEKEEITNGI